MRALVKKTDALTLAAIAGTAVITAAVYDRLPVRMATHFDSHGVANGWMPRTVGAWVIPALTLGLWAAARLLPRALPPAWRARAEASPLPAAALLITVFLCAMQALLLDAAIRGAMSTTRAVPWLLAGLLVGMSQILPRVRRNPLIGIRTAWTLTSDENWLRTHRLGGYTFFAAGVVAAVAALVAAPYALALSTAAVIAAALVPVGYSYYLARVLPDER